MLLMATRNLAKQPSYSLVVYLYYLQGLLVHDFLQQQYEAIGTW